VNAPEQEDVRAHYRGLAPAYGSRANQACERAYLDLARGHLAGAARILEIGCGAGQLLERLEAPTRVGCDLTLAMLQQAPPASTSSRVNADATCLPIADASFDAALSVNLIEHVPQPRLLLSEAARVLRPGGTLLLITPNGNLSGLLELLERLRLKLPEGPHRFVHMHELAAWSQPHFALEQHRSILAFPAGPRPLVQGIDRVFAGMPGCGLFQMLLARKRTQ